MPFCSVSTPSSNWAEPVPTVGWMKRIRACTVAVPAGAVPLTGALSTHVFVGNVPSRMRRSAPAISTPPASKNAIFMTAMLSLGPPVPASGSNAKCRDQQSIW